jgi:hypothetical protein
VSQCLRQNNEGRKCAGDLQCGGAEKADVLLERDELLARGFYSYRHSRTAEKGFAYLGAGLVRFPCLFPLQMKADRLPGCHKARFSDGPA